MRASMAARAVRVSIPIRVRCASCHRYRTAYMKQQKENRAMETTTQTRIRNFLAKFFQNVELKDNQDIFALGFVNSLFAMQLVLFIEKEFGIPVENEDLNIDNFRSISAITQLIEQKTAGQQVASS